MISVCETFISPNGEGITVGLMTIFVRVMGCNLAEEGHPCRWCDTAYAWYKNQRRLVTVDNLIANVDLLATTQRVKEICLTGGEPLYHEGVEELIYQWSRKYHLLVETNGSLPITTFRNVCWSMDIKCPSSGNDKYNRYENIELLTQRDQVKFVISDRYDYNFARDLVKRISKTNIILQPSWKQLSHRELIEWVKSDKDIVSKVRIGDQMHKRWYPRRKRGV